MISIEIHPNDSILSLKNKIDQNLNVPISHQILLAKFKILHDDTKTIDEYKITNEEFIYLVEKEYGNESINIIVFLS